MAVALKEIFARFGIDFDAKALQRGNEQVQGMAKKLADLGRQLAGPAIVTGALNFVRNMVAQGQELADQAAALNTSATSMREWQFVAEQNGVPAEQMNQALTTLAGNARASVSGNYDLAYSFRRLQVNVRDANGQLRPTGDLMAEVGTQIARIGNPLIRARLTMQHFGEAGRFLIPIFEKGATSINAMRQEVRDMVGGDLDELARQSRVVRGEQARFKLAFDALTTTLTLHLLPVFRFLVVSISKIIGEGKKLIENTRIIEAAMGLLAAGMVATGIQMALALSPVLGPIVAAGLAIAGLVLIVDDLLVFMAGGKSVIGDFFDGFLGAGASREIVDSLKLATEQMVNWLADIGLPKAEEFFTGLHTAAVDTIADIIEAFMELPRTIARLPGVRQVLGAVGAVGLEGALRETPRSEVRRAPRRGMDQSTIPDLPERVVAIQRVMNRGLPGVGQGILSGRPRVATDVRVMAPVAITVQTTEGMDNEAIAETVGRHQDERMRSALAHARNAVTNRVQSGE